MACYKPLIRFYVPEDREASGHVYTLRRFALERAHNPNLTYEDLIYRKDIMLIPCGQCIGCRIRKRQDWAARIEMEAKTSIPDSVYFLTITYDDAHVPCINHETGEVFRGGVYSGRKGNLKTNQTLWYEDVQKFIKRLRKASEPGLRYFCAGEYGEQTGRPHYHLILFNYFPEKLKPYRLLSKEGYFTDERITRLWPYGIHNLACTNDFTTFNYVAGYVTKKVDKETQAHIKNGLQPPFCRMSLHPGIGQQYYLEHEEEIWTQGYVQLSGGRRAQIPRYFEKQMEEKDIRRVWALKEARQAKAIDACKDKYGRTSVSIEEYLKGQEDRIKKHKKASGKI